MKLHEKLKYYEGEKVWYSFSDSLFYVYVGKQPGSNSIIYERILEEVGEGYVVLTHESHLVQVIVPFERLIVEVRKFVP